MNPQVLEELLLSHGRALQLFAAQWCDWPEDCVQQAFIKLALLGQPPQAPVPWLFRVVKNEAVSFRRKDARRKKRELEAWSNFERQKSDNSQALDSAELVAAVDGLDGDLRQVVVARFWGGLTFEEVAELANCSTSAAHRRYQTGINQLRHKLGLTWLTKE